MFGIERKYRIADLDLSLRDVLSAFGKRDAANIKLRTFCVSGAMIYSKHADIPSNRSMH